MGQIFDVFFLEAVLNGLLLGGLFALLSLGLNLIFGVIDVVWICYAELIMVGMYAIWWLHTQQGLPLHAQRGRVRQAGLQRTAVGVDVGQQGQFHGGTRSSLFC